MNILKSSCNLFYAFQNGYNGLVLLVLMQSISFVVLLHFIHPYLFLLGTLYWMGLKSQPNSMSHYLLLSWPPLSPFQKVKKVQWMMLSFYGTEPLSYFERWCRSFLAFTYFKTPIWDIYQQLFLEWASHIFNLKMQVGYIYKTRKVWVLTEWWSNWSCRLLQALF